MGAPRVRRLVVLRHAEAQGGGHRDHDRPLTEAGLAAATDVGRRLRELGLQPDLALISSATRAQQTWSSVAAGADWSSSSRTERSFYLCGAEEVLHYLNGLDAEGGLAVEIAGEEDGEVAGEARGEVDEVIVVGHNPTMASLVHWLDDLDDEAADDAARTDLTRFGYPPATASVLTWSGSWADLGPNSARLAHYFTGRG